jgi:hypothetical protein
MTKKGRVDAMTKKGRVHAITKKGCVDAITKKEGEPNLGFPSVTNSGKRLFPGESPRGWHIDATPFAGRSY